MTQTPTDGHKDTQANIFQRLHKVMLAIEYVQKEKKQGMRYSIVTHDAVTAAVRPKMVAFGIVYYPVKMTLNQNGNRTEVTMTVRFQNIDNPADSMDVVTAGFGIDDQDKGPGKAISYCVKYALLKALGLESGDDPDTDQNVTLQTAQQVQTPKEIQLLVDTARTASDLAEADEVLKKAYGEGRLTKADAQSLRGQIRIKLASLKEPA